MAKFLSPTTMGHKWDELHHAAFNNDVKIISALLERGHDVNSRTMEAETALHIASRKNNHQVVAALLENDADPNLLDDAKRTPYNVAVEIESSDCQDLLVKYGASTSARRAAIHTVQNDDVGSLRLLTSRYTFDELFQTDCNHPDKHTGTTDAQSSCPGGIKRRVGLAHHFGPLSASILCHNLEAMRVLLQYANVRGRSDICNLRECDGSTPIMELVRNWKNPEALKSLLEYGADANVVDFRGNVALFYAVKSGASSCFELLLDRTDREVLHRLSDEGKLLLEAVYKGRLDIARTLLCNGFKVNVAAADYVGKKDRPLDVAIAFGRMKLVRMLLDAGASLDFDFGCKAENLSSYDKLLLKYTGRTSVLWRSMRRSKTKPRVRSLMHSCRVHIRQAVMKCGRFGSLYDPGLDLNALGLPLNIRDYISFKWSREKIAD